jgi:hypothetical protein
MVLYSMEVSEEDPIAESSAVLPVRIAEAPRSHASVVEAIHSEPRVI